MRNLLIILFSILSFQIYAFGNSNPDSVFMYLETLSEKQQADTLKSIIVKNIFRDTKTTFVYVNKFGTLPAVQKDSSFICLTNYWTGMIYEIFGEYEKAIEYDFKSLEIAERIKNKKLIAITLNNIGLVYSFQKDYYPEALKYFKEYLKISKETNNETEIMGANMNIGMQFQRMNIPDSAEYYCRIAFDLAKKLDNKRNIGLSYSCLAELAKVKDNSDLYKDYSKKAIQIFKQEGYLIDLAALYFDISSWYLEKNDLKSALYYSNLMLDIAEEYNLAVYKQNALLLMSEIYKKSNKSDKAYQSLLAHIQLKDSISSNETKEKLAQLQTIYEVKLRDKKIENLKITQQLQERKEYFYLFLIFVIIVVSLIIVFYVAKNRRKDKLVNRQKLIIHNKERELSDLALEKSKANEKALEIKLAFKTRQLTTHAVSMMQKNKLMQELSGSLTKMGKSKNDEQKHEIHKFQQQIKRSLNVEKDWDLFKMYFENVNKDFFVKLLEIEPSLSSNDLRLSALIRLNMNIKEAASVFNVEPASVKSARYRLRKKLNLNPEDDLYVYMSNI
jgi:hypothetical protein